MPQEGAEPSAGCAPPFLENKGARVAFSIFLGLLLPTSIDTALGDDTVEALRGRAAIARETTIYRDCSAAAQIGNPSNLRRLQESWGRRYDAVRRYWRADNGEMIKHALTLEGTLTGNIFSTNASTNDVLAVLDRATVQITDEPDPAYAFVGSSIVVTTGFNRHMCQYLLPTRSFDELTRAVIATELGTIREAALSDSVKLLAEFFVNSIRYTGLQIFILAHESSHVLLDPFSKDLNDHKGFHEAKGCEGIQATFFTETRADIVGLSFANQLPVADKIDEFLRGQLNGFANEDIENMGKLAALAGFNDALMIVEKEKLWQPNSDCALGAFQRRTQLERASRSLEALGHK